MTGFGTRVCCALFALGASWLGCPRSARAQGSGLVLDYTAPAACPSKAAVLVEIARLVTRERTEPLSARVSVSGDEALGYRARIVVAGARERSFEGASCAEVTRASAVVLALALSPTQETPATPSATNGRVRSQPAATRLSLQASITADVGSLPQPDPGLALGLALSGQYWGVRVRGTYWLPVRTTVPDSGRGGVFEWWTVAGSACAAPLAGRSRVELCLGPELGELRGRGEGVKLPSRASTLWFDAVVGGEYSWALSAAQRLRGGVGMGVLLVGHRPFVLDEVQTVHEPSRIQGRAELGWAFIF